MGMAKWRARAARLYPPSRGRRRTASSWVSKTVGLWRMPAASRKRRSKPATFCPTMGRSARNSWSRRATASGGRAFPRSPRGREAGGDVRSALAEGHQAASEEALGRVVAAGAQLGNEVALVDQGLFENGREAAQAGGRGGLAR